MRKTQNVPQGSEYYFRVANSFRIGKYLCGLVFALFMIMMLFVYGDKITYNNFRYMLKDIDAAALLRTDATFASVSYQTEDPSFAALNGNLVIADKGTVTLYNPAGIEVYSVPFTGKSVALASDGKYLLAYNPGGQTFLLCNSITKLVSGTATGSLRAADVGKSGAFALAVDSNTTRYAVEVYNSSFSHSATYGVNDYIVDVAISDDGRSLAILTFTGTGDVPDTTLRLGVVGQESYSYVQTFSGEFPVSIDWSGEAVTVLTDQAAYFYSADGTLQTRYSVEGRTLAAVCTSDSHYAIATSKNGETMLSIFDRSGNMRYNERVSDWIRDMTFCEDSLLLLSSDRAVRLTLDDFLITETVVDDALCILGIENYGLTCGRKQASAIFVEEK